MGKKKVLARIPVGALDSAEAIRGLLEHVTRQFMAGNMTADQVRAVSYLCQNLLAAQKQCAKEASEKEPDSIGELVRIIQEERRSKQEEDA